MKKGKRISIIIAFGLILAGIAVSAAAYAAIDGDFTRLNTALMVENTYTVEEPFENIFISTELTDVELAVSEDGRCNVVCMEYENLKTTVEVRENTLSIRETDNRMWQENVGVFIGYPKITVYLPETDYESLSIGMANGDVYIPDRFSFVDAMVNTIRGDVNFSAAVKSGFASESVFGDISLTGVNGKKIICKSEQGAVTLADCDADTLKLFTVNGDVKAGLLSEKTFTVHTENGEAQVPVTTGGGTCEISTVNGNVKITVK